MNDDAITEEIDESHDLSLGSYELHVTGEPGDVEVWLNISTSYDGIAIGGGESKREAIKDAVETLEAALRVLRGL